MMRTACMIRPDGGLYQMQVSQVDCRHSPSRPVASRRNRRLLFHRSLSRACYSGIRATSPMTRDRNACRTVTHAQEGKTQE